MSAPTPSPAHERERSPEGVPGRATAAWCLGSLVVVALCAGVSVWVAGPAEPPSATAAARSGIGPPARLPFPGRRTTPAQPTTPDPADGYRWVDRDARIVAIPIDEAMRVLAEGEDADAGPGREEADPRPGREDAPTGAGHEDADSGPGR